MSSSLFNRGLPPRSAEERFSKAEPCAQLPFRQYSNPHSPPSPTPPYRPSTQSMVPAAGSKGKTVCFSINTYLWHPRWALQFVHPWGSGNVAETIALDAYPPESVLPPHLHVQFRPPGEPAARVVDVNRVCPCHQFSRQRVVALRLPLRSPLQQLEARARHDAPLRAAEAGGAWSAPQFLLVLAPAA